MNAPIVSYHPTLEADVNLLLVSQRALDRRDERAVAEAAAVLLPQSTRRDLYDLVAGRGKPHFPRADLHLNHDGKVGNFRLFAGLGLPHPATAEFAGLEQAAAAWREGRVPGGGAGPLVAKGAGGGEGSNVFLVNSPEELLSLGPRLETACRRGPEGMVLQELINTPGRDVRVIFIGPYEEAFWRVAADGEFRTNLSQKGVIDRERKGPELEACLKLARVLRAAAGLDVAAVDLVAAPDGRPLLLEINFAFGRHALGGTERFLELYLAAARHWLAGLGLDPDRIRLAD